MTISELKRLRGALAQAAQKVYDGWDDEAAEFEYAGGGICQDVASAMADVLSDKEIECSTVSAQTGEQHVWVVAQLDDAVVNVDISPYTYETGGGYSWKKIKGVHLSAEDVSIEVLDHNPRRYRDYIEETHVKTFTAFITDEV